MKEEFPHVMKTDAPPAYNPGARFKLSEPKYCGPGSPLAAVYKIEYAPGTECHPQTPPEVTTDELKRWAAA